MIREELADYAHRAWSGWMQYLFEKSCKNPDGTVTIPKWAVDRWNRQMNTDYKNLTEDEKNSDRKEADEMLAIIEHIMKDYMKKFEDKLFSLGAMEGAPCFVCGYNGPRYFQPETHACAKRHHKLNVKLVCHEDQYPCHFRPTNRNISACGVVNPKIAAYDARDVTCERCRKTVEWKRKI